ncbi:MAG: hypothetical protein IPF99_34880 [Deltaproteobacteria bacterium]|nr:hypothetical protein [Deltaproteobacteria bacterium]
MSGPTTDTDDAVPRHYVLQCFSPLFDPVLALGALPEVDGVESWMAGTLITTSVPQPVEVTVDRDEPGDLLELYQLEALVMSERLVSALRAAGVDNLQVFDLVIRAPESGRVFTTHKLVNVVGRVACADLTRSTYASPRGSPLIDVDFDGLAIDEGRAGDHLLFRLAECVSAVIVHEQLRRQLIDQGFSMLTFQLPSEFVG